MFFDSNYIIFVMIPTLLLSFGVQLYLRSTYGKWSKVRNSGGMTGMQVSDLLFDRTALNEIPMQVVPGQMTDHFDPRANVVRLSQGTAGQPSVAAMAIAAHELGHVQQYQTGSALIKARNFLVPAVQFSPTVSYMAILIGFMLNITGLIWVGIVFFGVMVFFTLLTLPVEFDASRRGLQLLTEAGLMQSKEDQRGARAVLRAAALTYVAAAITSVLQLLYYISIANRRR
ncbi:putative membrane protease YugP [Candidatus Promineifilum breve]|uniref:Membrane protease YugP n=1 Tax=Candidatus Promineifilum breve TaxID=1806508 RepID=A0A160T6S2_9CHLR|nr:zinc metallopeptidase [Candidatus Promineifilum breve]CUS06121.1 putative membrane protease YugP [Candidatus Promineifilum breve]